MKKQKILALFSILGSIQANPIEAESKIAIQDKMNETNSYVQNTNTEEKEYQESKKNKQQQNNENEATYKRIIESKEENPDASKKIGLRFKNRWNRFWKKASHSREDSKANRGTKQVISKRFSDRTKTDKHLILSYNDWKHMLDSDLETSVRSELKAGSKYYELSEKFLVEYMQAKEQYKVIMAKFKPLYEADLKIKDTFKQKRDYEKLLELTNCKNQIEYQEKKLKYKKIKAASAGRNFAQVCSNLKAARENLDKRKTEEPIARANEVYAALINDINEFIRNNPTKKQQVEINKINREAREQLMEKRARKYGLSEEKTKLFTDLSMTTQDKIEEIKANRREDLKEIDSSFVDDNGKFTNKGKKWLKTPEGEDFSKKYSEQIEEVGQAHEQAANEINPDRMKNGQSYKKHKNNDDNSRSISNEEDLTKENYTIEDNSTPNNLSSTITHNNLSLNSKSTPKPISDIVIAPSRHVSNPDMNSNLKKDCSGSIVSLRLEALRKIHPEFITSNSGISSKGQKWLKNTKEGKAFNAEYAKNIKEYEAKEKIEREEKRKEKIKKIEKTKKERPQTAEKRSNKYNLDKKAKNESLNLAISTGKTMDLIEQNYLKALKKQNKNFVDVNGRITKAGKKWLNSTEEGKKLKSDNDKRKREEGKKHEEQANKINPNRKKNNKNKTKDNIVKKKNTNTIEKNRNAKPKNMEQGRIDALKRINSSYVTAQCTISNQGRQWLKTSAGKSFDAKYVKMRKAVVDKRNDIRADKRKKTEQKQKKRPQTLDQRAYKNRLEGEKKTKYVNLSNQTKFTMDSIDKERINALQKKDPKFITLDGRISNSGKKWLRSTDEGKKLNNSCNQKKRSAGKKHEKIVNELNSNRIKSQENKNKIESNKNKKENGKKKPQVAKKENEKKKPQVAKKENGKKKPQVAKKENEKKKSQVAKKENVKKKPQVAKKENVKKKPQVAKKENEKKKSQVAKKENEKKKTQKNTKN